MKSNILTDYYIIELPMIDQYILSYKEEFAEKFGKDVWDKIVKLNGIPFLLISPDCGIRYTIQRQSDVICPGVYKRFQCNTHFPGIDTFLNTVVIPKTNNTNVIWIEEFNNVSFGILPNLLKVNKYSWICGIRSINEYGVVMADKLYLD